MDNLRTAFMFHEASLEKIRNNADNFGTGIDAPKTQIFIFLLLLEVLKALYTPDKHYTHYIMTRNPLLQLFSTNIFLSKIAIHS